MLQPLGFWSCCDLDPWLTFWPQTFRRSSLSQNASTLKVSWNSVPKFSRCGVDKAKSAFPEYWTNRDLELWPFESKTWITRPCPKTHQSWKFGNNTSNTFQDIVLTTTCNKLRSLRWWRRKDIAQCYNKKYLYVLFIARSALKCVWRLGTGRTFRIRWDGLMEGWERDKEMAD